MNYLTPEEEEDLRRIGVVRQTAEATYAKFPADVDNLMRWGGALLEMAHFHPAPDGNKLINDAISKFEEVLSLDPSTQNTLWCLGNAHSSLGFLTADSDEAKPHFYEAAVFYKRAVDQEPDNELYQKSLEVSEKAPELHREFLKASIGQQSVFGESSPSPNVNLSKKNKKQNSDLKYDIFGWVILIVGFFAWVGMAKSHVPPSPRS